MMLDDVDPATVQLFPNKYWGRRTLCRFVDFYDGDTATIVFDDAGGLMACKFRFFGYDSPEMKVSSKIGGAERRDLKAAAVGARDFLCDFLADKRLVVHFSSKREKWGRLMGEVYYFPLEPPKPAEEYRCTDDNSVSALMVREGHGYNYYGGAKKTWTSTKE
jgi:endonuclease YncB( thermonuclease family)